MVLPVGFYTQPVDVVAVQLLGKLLFTNFNHLTGGVIIETEAYSQDDAASHSYRGLTARNQTMFGPAGCVYVYRSYGIHICANVVTGQTGEGEAVLIRALVPWTGLAIMRPRRGAVPDKKLCQGPGNLCQALGITLHHQGLPLTPTHNIWCEDKGIIVPDQAIQRTPRIGITRNTAARRRYYWPISQAQLSADYPDVQPA